MACTGYDGGFDQGAAVVAERVGNAKLIILADIVWRYKINCKSCAKRSPQSTDRSFSREQAPIRTNVRGKRGRRFLPWRRDPVCLASGWTTLN
jgi:hypothetical protein